MGQSSLLGNIKIDQLSDIEDYKLYNDPRIIVKMKFDLDEDRILDTVKDNICTIHRNEQSFNKEIADRILTEYEERDVRCRV